MNPTTKDRLDLTAAEAIRRAIFCSSIFNNADAGSGIGKGYWSQAVVRRNLKEAVAACRLSGGLQDAVPLLDAFTRRASEIQRKKRNTQAQSTKLHEVFCSDWCSWLFGIWFRLFPAVSISLNLRDPVVIYPSSGP